MCFAGFLAPQGPPHTKPSSPSLTNFSGAIAELSTTMGGADSDDSWRFLRKYLGAGVGTAFERRPPGAEVLKKLVFSGCSMFFSGFWKGFQMFSMFLRKS